MLVVWDDSKEDFVYDSQQFSVIIIIEGRVEFHASNCFRMKKKR